jgi:hypothetical protein
MCQRFQPASEALRDGAVAAEVAVNLKRECVGADEHLPACQFVHRFGKHGIGNDREIVSDDDFPEQSGEYIIEALAKSLVVQSRPRIGYLTEKVRRALNRASEKLRKK